MATASVTPNSLLDVAGDRYTNSAPTHGIPARVRLGTGSQAPTAGTTSLTTPAPISFTAVDSCDATTGWSASTDGSLATDSTAGEFIEGTACLELIKTATTVTGVTYSKTVTTTNFTGKDLWVWVNISSSALAQLASSSAVKVRFGTDSSNYYEKDYDASALSSGSQWLTFNTGNATSTTGSPSSDSCAYFAIIITATAITATWSGNDIRLDHIHVAASADYYRAYDSVPVFDSVKNQTTSTVTINTTDAIGQPLTNASWETSDGSLVGLDEYSVDTKSQDEQWQLNDTLLFIQVP